ncbi:MAG: amidohydrolase, partial [Desulfobulbaceae bacterium]|nr:amidohydrolase [Desulfobulbaceae bacterium]
MSTTRFIVVGGFVDGTGADLRRNVFLAVKNGVIVEIGRAADLPARDTEKIDDLSHCTILPVLVDCSLSLTRSPSVGNAAGLLATDTDSAKMAVLMEQHVRYCFDHGVLGVAEDGELTGVRQRYGDEPAQAELIDIRTPGRLHRSETGWALDDLTAGDYLKIRYSANIETEEARFLRLAHEDLRRILRNKGEKKAVVVANGPEHVAEAIDAGCDAIEQGYLMGEENLGKMAERNVLWIPSVLRAKNTLDGVSSGGTVCCRFSQRYVAPGKPLPGVEEFWKKMLDLQLKQLAFAKKIGVET